MLLLAERSELRKLFGYRPSGAVYSPDSQGSL